MKKPLVVLMLLSAVCLAGCENEAASYMIDGNKDHSISLVREQRWFWSSSVEQRFVVARFPECQRRYDIDPGQAGAANVELYAVSNMLYAAHQGNAWYALGTEQCQVQKFTEAPASPPGTLVGHFKSQNGQLVFSAAESEPPATK